MPRLHLVLIIALAAAVWGASSTGYDVEAFDDAFIIFRYAENWHQGLGPVFNQGERVEGFSCPLFVALLAFLRSLGLSLLGAASLVTFCAFAGCLVLVAAWVTDTSGRPLLGWVAALLVALHPSVILFLHSGMETLLFAFLILLTFFLLRRPPATIARAVAIALVAVAAAWTRPEGLLIVACSGLVLAYDHRAGRLARPPLIVFATLSLALLLASYGTRYAYYGAWLPNTYYAKAMVLSAKRLARGIEYALGGPAVFLCAPFALAVLTRRPAPRQRRTWCMALLAVGAVAIFAVWAGGDWMAGHRFLVPALPLAAVLWGLAGEQVLPVLQPPRSPLVLAGLALVIGLWAGRSGLTILHDLRRLEAHSIPFTRAHATLGRWIDRHTDPNTMVAIGAVGAVGYTSHRRILDAWGLTDAHIARQGKKAPRQAQGHQSYDGAYVWRRRPHLIFLLNDFSPRPLSESAYRKRALSAREPSSAWADELLAQKEFETMYTYQPLEVARGVWFGSYVRHDIEGDLKPQHQTDG